MASICVSGPLAGMEVQIAIDRTRASTGAAAFGRRLHERCSTIVVSFSTAVNRPGFVGGHMV